MRKPNGESKGFGFVCYKTAEAALSAIDAMHNATLGTKQLYVGFAQQKNHRKADLALEHKNRVVYVWGLHYLVDDYALKQTFQQFGYVFSGRVSIFILFLKK